MLDQPDTLFVVLGYQCHLTSTVRRYLDAAAEEIMRVDDQRVTVITSGGFTNQRSAPGVSEARLIADYLRVRGVTADVILDETPRTTVENIRGLARIFSARGLAPKRVVIIGDQIRRQKIAMLARYFRLSPVELSSVDLDRSSTQSAVQRVLGYGFDYLAVRISPLERLGLAVIELRMRLT